MTKAELIARLTARFPQLVEKDAELALKMILDAMGKSLAKGEHIDIQGFGSFRLNIGKSKQGASGKSFRHSGFNVKVPKYTLTKKMGSPGIYVDDPFPAPAPPIKRPGKTPTKIYLGHGVRRHGR